MTEYAAGTVAVATVRGVPNVRVMRTNGTRGGDDLWFSAVHVADWPSHMSSDVTDVRPLVVLDLDQREAESLVYLLRKDADAEFSKEAKEDPHVYGRGLATAETRRRAADQIEAQAKPPRIPEPGLWGVVEAKIPRGAGSLVNDGAGWLDSFGRHFEWTDLVDPVLVRPGIEDES